MFFCPIRAVDQAGWHLSAGLVVPDNITLVVLPPKCPELNPAENVWQTVCSLPKRRWLVPRYAANEDCAGWTGAASRIGDEPCNRRAQSLSVSTPPR